MCFSSGPKQSRLGHVKQKSAPGVTIKQPSPQPGCIGPSENNKGGIEKAPVGGGSGSSNDQRYAHISIGVTFLYSLQLVPHASNDKMKKKTPFAFIDANDF